MSGHQYATLEDTVYFWFASNDTSGSGDDGATPLFDVREAGASASAIPLLSGTPDLLTHANFPLGCHEIAVAATDGNGFAAGDTFAVFCTLAVDSQNPTGFVGSCTLNPVPANIEEYLGVAVTGTLITSEDVGLVFESVITTSTTEKEFITATAFAHDDIWNGKPCTVFDDSGVVLATGYVEDCIQSTNTIHVFLDSTAGDGTSPFAIEDGVDILRIYVGKDAGIALDTYDGTTRSESTTDTNSILAKLLAYVRLQTRSDGFVDIDDATELTAINADAGAGAGDYDPETDSLEAAEAGIGAIPTTAMRGTDSAATEVKQDTMQTAVDAVKTKTDQLAFTKANELDINLKSQNDVTMLGAGIDSDKWRG